MEYANPATPRRRTHRHSALSSEETPPVDRVFCVCRIAETGPPWRDWNPRATAPRFLGDLSRADHPRRYEVHAHDFRQNRHRVHRHALALGRPDDCLYGARWRSPRAGGSRRAQASPEFGLRRAGVAGVASTRPGDRTISAREWERGEALRPSRIRSVAGRAFWGSRGIDLSA
jgi:hypothetical protein